MSIEELRAKKDSLAEGESLRIAIKWNNSLGSLPGWLVDVFDETFTIKTDSGEYVQVRTEQMIGSAMLVKNML